MTKKCYISVDGEMTGSVPEYYHLFELGACLIEDPEVGFETLLAVPTGAAYEPEALAAIKMTPEGLPRSPGAPDPENAMKSFASWVKEVAGERTPIFVANNAPFDWMFVAHGFEKARIKNPFGHNALDMKAYFMGKTDCSWREATLGRMAAHVGLPTCALPHRALLDAKIQAEIFAKLIV